jgi:hypothetical protein
MKNRLLNLAIAFLYLPLGLAAQPHNHPKPPCAANLASCPDQGCGTQFDPNLNHRKNLTADSQSATVRTLTWIKKLDDPENFSEGDTREELTGLGEGQKITVLAYLLQAKGELGGESCNCGLKTAADTDNHLVLVSRTTLNKFPATSGSATSVANKNALKKREKESITAEFTPRVRLDHPNFTREKIQPMIDATAKKALLVRVTGLLLFDSEHFLKNHLVRVNNWEIHPVMSLEICTTGYTCKINNDAGWKSLDEY